MAGFYCRNFIWTGNGQSNTNNAIAICKGCAKALIRCGWSLDSSTHNGIDDIKSYGSGNNYCCWYVLNGRTENGAKLLVFYNYQYRTVPQVQTWGYNGRSVSSWTTSDLCLAMIPAGSESTFGSDPTAENPKFIPNDATYLCGVTYDSNYCRSVAYNSNNGAVYEWCFLSNGIDSVFMYVRRDSVPKLSFGIGKLVDALSYPEVDNYPQSKYMVLQLSNYNSAGDYGTNSADFGLRNFTTESNSESYNLLSGDFSTFVFRGDGNRFLPQSSVSTSNCNLFSDMSLSNRYICSSYNNGQRRWSPFGVAICNRDPASGQVIHGADGFKGYLDTNKIRFVGTFNIQREQLLDDGNFIHAHNGLVLAWDSSNTIKLTYINSAIDTRNWNGGADPFA